ncbi:MAG: hypothetical protein MPEBLZ_00083 [Candidatus Methanoperedens nitroreducens]|uniref:Metal-dependent hydrolase n=1 Tax=Candidatus Methanoperedens nitratireducens TaxID=1392998 RepID=A0A0P8CNL2_9EURY|nr:hypothetical protein [Candidatus Methanoperedens sp. BLZ2]KAB2940618.1 MAG: hypothetical protein F9K14_19240 [Candidatus Methanoperedens sp.]KPQ45331.1 MAG: hypothetical protein MPEBLZ_00083 [Candidatus Methanoperedens sp. BLZ1]MBZ0177196.1 hypothetical protein [Candidatus Methanoperedens nitroreducens]MCX9079551.1 hypothetical protein [Candidatus Methanoperedens sp.]
MFIGHYGIGLVLKKVEPRLSLGLLIFGAIMLDILFGLFLLSGIEHAKIVHGATVVSPFEFYDYPYSHSAVGAVLWATAGFLAYWLWPTGDRTQRKRPAFILTIAIFSHFILDVISHTPDITISGNNSPILGLSLWDSLAGTMIVEFGILFIGIYLYRSATYSVSSSGKYGFALMILILVVLYIGNIFGPPPPDMKAVAVTMTAGQLALVALAFWVDRNRITI